MKRYITRAVLLAFIAFACETPTKSKNEQPHIVATTGMLYDAVINIGGNKCTAEVLMGPGVDPHLYKATQGDLAKLRNADLIIYNGLLLEGKMSDILEKLGRQKPVVAAASSVPPEMLISATDYENAFDPHVWFDVKRWKYVVKKIASSLIKLDTVNEGYYQQNLANYLTQLDSLDHFVRTRLNEVPDQQRILITAHDAFIYFGDAYHMQVEGLQGISTVADFGLKDITNLIDLIIKNNIKAIFVETSVSEKSINAVVKGCQEKGHHVTIGGALYSDAMGEPGTVEGTYIGMFRRNVDTIVEALK